MATTHDDPHQQLAAATVAAGRAIARLEIALDASRTWRAVSDDGGCPDDVAARVLEAAQHARAAAARFEREVGAILD